jgi:phosphoenolpyruvate carboxykinase (ATP)
LLVRIAQAAPTRPQKDKASRKTWSEKDAYDDHARKLADLFKENFEKFEGEVGEGVRLAGPQ